MASRIIPPMTVAQLKALIVDLPDHMEVGAVSYIGTPEDRDDLNGHTIETGYVEDFPRLFDGSQKPVLLLQINRDDDAHSRWTK